MVTPLFTFTPDTVISSTQNQISSELAGEAVILNLSSGVYYGLNAVGARVWEIIQQPKRFGEVLEILLEEYDVQPEACGEDLEKILRELMATDLVKIES
ncbi:MAG: PqqD family peptide modification chaperone [Phormidesmis sp.]